MSVSSLESLIAQHKDEPWPMPACKCGEVCPEERQTDDFDAWHAAHVAEVIRQHHTVTTSTYDRSCGGCEGKGAHSPRCRTQPGWFFRRLADQAAALGDAIGPNDYDAANTAWVLAARLRKQIPADGAEDHQ
ncbi:hypothetical protein SEA_LEROY_85 [Gordonia phage Leroy]|nr:hypothetical protein HOT94_gp082 [Gordonia phage Phistory]AXQ64787.1 hypothetical protein SEA_PHISTORY_82 [Gordonia phage Phistory]QYC53751.1 hypothetical protein SEA_LEROY_85 [Gordonia phage Leroy]UTN91548.1 hypothetical protein SEA_PERIWINKLE_94 [Gordonia phage Periwinkle]